MRDLTSQILPRLETNRLPELAPTPPGRGIDLGPGLIYPFYDGLSIANLPASLCAWLGVEALPGSAPALDPTLHGLWNHTFRNVILFVVDGFGLDMLQAALTSGDTDLHAWRELPQDAALAPLTSVVPSTTATALTTFWSGALPAEHAVVGYEVFLKEYGLIANMILHNPASYTGDPGSLYRAGFRAETFLPVPVLGPHLKRQGVSAYAFLHRSISGSSFSNSLHVEAAAAAVHSLSDLFINLSDLLDAPGGARNYIYIYWSNLDDMSHRYGPGDPRVRRELGAFSQQLAIFLKERGARSGEHTLLVITADHGHISTPRYPSFEVRNHPRLLDCMTMLPSGEARLPYVYLRPGREEQFLEYIEQTWGGRFKAFPSAALMDAGLWGGRSRSPRLAERTGDRVIVPQGEEYWYFGSKENQLLGRHGGLSRTEMLVPFLSMLI